MGVEDQISKSVLPGSLDLNKQLTLAARMQPHCMGALLVFLKFSFKESIRTALIALGNHVFGSTSLKILYYVLFMSGLGKLNFAYITSSTEKSCEGMKDLLLPLASLKNTSYIYFKNIQIALKVVKIRNY